MIGRICALAFLVLTLELWTALPAAAGEQHAIAMHGEPKEAADFKHFGYVNPDAPKGGKLVLGTTGSYDSLNPFIIKGTAAAGVNDYVFESLLARGRDEPFTLYGLVAESVDMPEDRSSITFNLNPKARFSDGQPITADDVLFSFALLKEKGRPNHRTYYAKATKAEKLSDQAVKFTFDISGAGDREIPLIFGLMPVLPKHKLNAETFENTTLDTPVGSGPYRIAHIDAGRSITYVRNPEYWGRDLAVNKGRFNFDEIRYEYFRDASVMFEAFKSGLINVRSEEDAALWSGGYNSSAAVADGRIKRTEFATGLPAGMTALAFNLRRPMFQNQKVRQALIQLFDAEFANKSLYYGLFNRTQSYFERSVLSSAGRPADEAERRLLAPFADQVKPDVLAGTYRFPTSDGSGQNRTNWRIAFELLSQAGYVHKGTKLVDAKSGEALTFEILTVLTGPERLLGGFVRDLQRLGIEARVRVVDSSQYQQRLMTYDYDMIQNSWPVSLSPGNEQLFRWSSEAAKVQGTFNFVGVENPAADAMIAALLAAKSEAEFTSAVRAFDRVLLSGDYVIPLFYPPKQWVAYWTQFAFPDQVPLFGNSLDTWWWKAAP